MAMSADRRAYTLDYRLLNAAGGYRWVMEQATPEPVQVREVVHRYRDQAIGEIRHPILVVPRVDLKLEPSAKVWPTGVRTPQAFTVTLQHGASEPTRGTVALELPAFGVGEGWVGEVLRTGQVAAWSDAREDPRHGGERYDGIVDFAGDLIAPLIHHDKVIGALSAVTREPRDWTDGDIAFLTTLATHAGIALSNAALFEQTETRAAQLAVLQTASGRLSRASSLEAVGRTVVEETRGIIDYHNARVYLLEPPDQVVPIAFEGRVGAYEHVDFDLLRCRVGEGFTGWVAQHGEPLLINDANSDPRGATIAGTDEIDESMLVVPMRYDGITVGVITLSKLGFDGFDADDLRLLTILADHAATAVETARLIGGKEPQATLDVTEGASW